ncbi:MAG: hypothetical protein ACTSRS_21870 [Candidatus Helarchaeota archaeon]
MDDTTGDNIYFRITDKFYGGIGGGAYELQSYSLDTWYWIELVWTSPNSQSIYINGAKKHEWYNFDKHIGENTSFTLYVAEPYNAGVIYIDGIRIADDLEYPPPNEYAPPTQGSLQSLVTAETICLDGRIIDIEIGKSCSPAIYKVVQRESVLDSSLYDEGVLELSFVVRFASDELATLKSIFESGYVKVKIGGWTFTGWFVDKNTVWDYSEENKTRPWKVTLMFDITSREYVEV